MKESKELLILTAAAFNIPGVFSLNKDDLILISDEHDPWLSQQWRLKLWGIQQITKTQVIVPKTYRKR